MVPPLGSQYSDDHPPAPQSQGTAQSGATHNTSSVGFYPSISPPAKTQKKAETYDCPILLQTTLSNNFLCPEKRGRSGMSESTHVREEDHIRGNRLKNKEGHIWNDFGEFIFLEYLGTS